VLFNSEEKTQADSVGPVAELKLENRVEKGEALI